MEPQDPSLESLQALWQTPAPFDGQLLVRKLQRAAFQEGMVTLFYACCVPFGVVGTVFLIHRHWVIHHDWLWAFFAVLGFGSSAVIGALSLWVGHRLSLARRKLTGSPADLLQGLLESHRMQLRVARSPWTWLVVFATVVGLSGINAVAMLGGYSPMGMGWFVMLFVLFGVSAVVIAKLLQKTRAEVKVLEEMLRSVRGNDGP